MDAQGRQMSYFGRTKEISCINRCIKATDRSRHIIYISGSGGVGKTALLDLILDTFAASDDISVALEIVDFDDLTLRLPNNLMKRLVAELRHKDRRDLFGTFSQLLERHTTGETITSIECQRGLKDALIAGLNELAQKRRLVLLIDTLEKAPLWFAEFFASLVSQIENLVIVLVGRPPSRPIAQRIAENLPAFQKQFFEEWRGLDLAWCEDYFAGSKELKELMDYLEKLGIKVSPDLRQRIWTLAEGIPFQINLAAGVLRYLDSRNAVAARQVNDLFRQVQRTPQDELMQDPDLRQRFQQALVAPLVSGYNRPPSSGSDIDYDALTSRIILLLAHINHYMAYAAGGFDASTLAKLDATLDQKQVQHGMDYIEQNQARLFTFVKLFRGANGQVTGIGLHDEMVRMLNRLAWLRLDPPGLRASYRKAISEKLIGHYNQKCLDLYAKGEQIYKDFPDMIWKEAVKFPEGQALLLARVSHGLYLDFKQGWEWIYNLSESIFRTADFDSVLYEFVDNYAKEVAAIDDPDIQARMDVWHGVALLAQRELGEARRLFQKGIDVWTEMEQDKDNKAVLRSLERVHVSLGFSYRLESKWQQAIDHYKRALECSFRLKNRERIAELTNNIANVYLMWERLTDAALYGQISTTIRRQLNMPRELGNSYFILSKINWRIGNTYECKMYLNRARGCYQNDPVALAWLDSYEGYTYCRIGDTDIGHEAVNKIPTLQRCIPPVRSYPLLEQARGVFEQYERKDDLAETYNILSRAYRRDGRFEEAEKTARQVLELTSSPFLMAEAHLSLLALYYRWGEKNRREGNKEDAEALFKKADEHYAQGFELAQKGQFIAMLSVYEGFRGNVEYARGENDPCHYSIAFRHYLSECLISAQSKEFRFERALNEVVADRLARMPPDLANAYAEMLTDQTTWKQAGLEHEYEKLRGEIDELALFLSLPPKEQIDAMEKRFTDYMQSGSYEDALREATTTLQQFHRYNWNFDTVRVLLRTAQACRKVGSYTSARRYCKQALLISEKLIAQKNKSQVLELEEQKAHADFTMGRILWEIGNTAEAATHFRLARETFSKYLKRRDKSIARNMREGLAHVIEYEGLIRFRIGEWDQALKLLDWAEKESHNLQTERRMARILNTKARIYRDRDAKGDIEKARQALSNALTLAQRCGDKYTIAECFLTGTILEHQESRQQTSRDARLEQLEKARQWYQQGVTIALDNHYTLLLSVYTGMLGNILFDELLLKAQPGEKARLEPAFDQYIEECRWDAHCEKRRFFRSLDLLMRRLGLLSGDEIRFYINYMRQKWHQYAQEGKLPGRNDQERESSLTAEYVKDMDDFCNLVEEFSEYIAAQP